MLTILRFIIQFGIKKAIKKFGKSAVSKATKKPVPKSKPVKHKTELQRVKAQIAKDLKTPKVKPITGKIVGKVRRNYGKWEPTYARPVKPKPIDLTSKANKPGWRRGMAKGDFWHWNGKKWIVKGMRTKVKPYRPPKKP